jgi:hypothetical protein
MAEPSDVLQAPPPWQLTGCGTLLLFRFSSDFVMAHSPLPAFLAGCYRGGLGAVMLVDYQTSPVGPYREALFIPGSFEYTQARYYSITQIAVSTLASVVNGRQNWGIPKVLADLEVEVGTDDTQRFAMRIDDLPAMDITIRARGPQLPFNTRWLPFQPTLIQQRDNGELLTIAPYGKGRVRLARIDQAFVNPGAFPDFTQLHPIAVVHATHFELTFPHPRILSTGETHAAQ